MNKDSNHKKMKFGTHCEIRFIKSKKKKQINGME